MKLQFPARGLLALVVTCLSVLGCPAKPAPGDVPMGTYAMFASSGQRGFLFDAGVAGDAGDSADAGDAGAPPIPQCELIEVTAADFEFSAVLTRESTSDRAWLTLNGYSRESTFDGQLLSSQAEANRVFEACATCTTRVVETIDVAVLSRSQNEAAGGVCPENALDGGVVVKPDAGIVAPAQTAQGYDAVLLCGELRTTVVALGLPDGGACDRQCGGCTVRYQLRGERR